MVGSSVASNGQVSVEHTGELLPVVCLMGPTATGKTDAAAQLTESLDAEIISVDSSLVYRGMDIGTAKPDAEFLRRYPHHLVDIRDPNDTYSVADFYQDCTRLIEQITARGRVPILAGGTMFYYNALEQGLTDLPQANPALRAEIDSQAKALGWTAMHQKLAQLDSESAARIDPQDTQRVQRALEIVMSSGMTVQAHNAKRKPGIANPLVKIALAFSDRSVLHERIALRFDIMLEQGLQSEVEALLQSGVNRDTPAMRMIGYRQMLEFLEDGLTKTVMRDKGVAATRQLAKRQLTWLRNQRNVLWWMDSGLKDKQFQPLVQLVRSIIRV
ncbi:tRNA (adenosine(37)-N6)-dimethylallyltransferase MiaA [Arenicella xantha]|uniref:tRNA dimethylallyltransferase n=1 Tax=Arenicella xantha TaxID=644221 RepID=A0A395JKM9_9GAMM|nr:tRNA (adenosine(37)-N6)-dimethylallyltransferase MiaA [Arenicella xantha]RBP49338.1 tRNA dimethylallyltransferase [Arenicella xantha]